MREVFFINLTEFKSLKHLDEILPTEDHAREYFALVRWGNKPICPYCNNDHCYVTSDKRYKCSKCRRMFTVKVGTIFENSKIPLKVWFQACFLLSSASKGTSSVQMSKIIGVTQKTAWYMIHRIREANSEPKKELGNVVEVDESFVGGLEGNKHHSKRLYPGGGTAGKTTVLGLLERGGLVQTFVVPSNSKEILQPIIERYVKTSAIIMTDEHKAYSELKDIFLDHRVVKHGRGEFVSKTILGGIKTHTNSIEGFWSLVKRAIIGVHHYISRKHLHRYLNDICYKYNSKGDSVSSIMHGTLWNSLGKRLTYKQLIL